MTRKLGGRRLWAILALVTVLGSIVAVGPVAAAEEVFEYRFEFVNGQVLEGVADQQDALIEDAGGAFADAPSGMIVHLSCSDEFPGGWGEKQGPDEVTDSAWQISSYTINKYKDGVLDKTCSAEINTDIPAHGTIYQYRFEFANGQVAEGTSDNNVAFVPDAGGTDPNNPTGMDVHVSCSDAFPGGWGEKDGPDQVADSAWQISSYTINKYKDGKLDKTCSAEINGDVPASGTVYMYRFEFVNGQVAEGSSPDNEAFVPDAGGTDPNNPTGMDVHISCSDEFPGGWGEKKGPDEVVDSAWQILRWEINKYKDGQLDKTCSGGLPEPPPPPPAPSIDLEKTVNGEDADFPTGPVVNVGDTVTIGYTVENTGNVLLTEVQVIDADLGPVTCPLDELAPGEIMTCNEAFVLVESEGQQFMEADVSGKANVGGTPAPMPADPEAQTIGYAFTFVNGQVVTGFSDNNTAFLPDAGGTDPNNPTGMEVHVSCSDEFPGGFGEKDGPDPTADSAWQIASYSIIKWDKGEINKQCGETFTPVMQTVTDNDPVYYIAEVPSAPSIDIEKTVNGIDADDPPGPQFTVGDEVTIEYVVTNTGNVKLFNIVVIDSHLGVRNCESTMLEPGASMSCDTFVEVLTEPGAVFMEAKVTGFDDAGTMVMDADPIHFTVVDTVPPPEVCSIELVDDTVVVTWSAVPGAVEYEVYRNTGRRGRTTETMFVDRDIPPLIRLWYSVSSIDAAGNVSDPVQCGNLVYNPSE